MSLVDTSTAGRRTDENVLAAFAQFERDVIQRAHPDLWLRPGSPVFTLGRWPQIDDVIVARITDLSKRGLSLRAICKRLTEDGYPTVNGGVWQASVGRPSAQVCGCRSGIMIPPGGGAS